MSSTSFSSALPTLLATLPPSTPYAVHVPLLSAVLSRLNEPDAISELFDFAVHHLEPAAAVDEPGWATVVRDDWLALDVRGRSALVLAVRVREALLKVRLRRLRRRCAAVPPSPTALVG